MHARTNSRNTHSAARVRADDGPVRSDVSHWRRRAATSTTPAVLRNREQGRRLGCCLVLDGLADSVLDRAHQLLDLPILGAERACAQDMRRNALAPQ
jgi:hypothetical protein